jgi:hypothetical protein
MRVTAISLALVASSLPGQGITWGPELGVNMSKYGGKDATDAKNKIGLLAGVAVKHQKAGSKMFLRSGIGYSQRGSKFSSTGSTGSVKFNYIEIPAMVGWSFPMANSKMTPHVAGGAALGIKASCKSEFTSGASTTKDDCTTASGDVKSMDIMVGGGGGVTIASAKGDCAIDLLYLLGLSTIDNPPTGTTATEFKNRGITVKVSYWMKKKKM